MISEICVCSVCVYVFFWVILSDGRRKHTESLLFRSVPKPVSDLGLLTNLFSPSSGEFHKRTFFLLAISLYAAPCTYCEEERSCCLTSKYLFQSEVKSMRCLFAQHLYSSCSAGLLMIEILDLNINTESQ